MARFERFFDDERPVLSEDMEQQVIWENWSDWFDDLYSRWDEFFSVIRSRRKAFLKFMEKVRRGEKKFFFFTRNVQEKEDGLLGSVLSMYRGLLSDLMYFENSVGGGSMSFDGTLEMLDVVLKGRKRGQPVSSIDLSGEMQSYVVGLKDALLKFEDYLEDVYERVNVRGDSRRVLELVNTGRIDQDLLVDAIDEILHFRQEVEGLDELADWLDDEAERRYTGV